MLHHLNYKECHCIHKNTTTQYNIYQKIWSSQTVQVTFHPEKNMPIELQQNIHNMHFTPDKLNTVRSCGEISYP